MPWAAAAESFSHATVDAGAVGTRPLRATVLAVIGRPQSAKSTPRHRILQSVRKHVMATFPAVLPCPIFALLIVLQKYSVGSNL
jgi:hypothetical protein